MSEQRSEPLVLGLDIGTGSSKAILYQKNGTRYGEGISCSYSIRTDARGRAELNPEDVFRATCQAIQRSQAGEGILPGQIKAVGLSSAWHSLVAIDDEGRPLTGILTWGDTRPSKSAERLRAQLDGIEIHRITGCPLHPVYLPANIA